MSFVFEKEMLTYLHCIRNHYFNGRVLLFNDIEGTSREIDISGVPQRSILDSTMWNIIFDDLLRVRWPTMVEFIAYTDDVVIITTAHIITT